MMDKEMMSKDMYRTTEELNLSAMGFLGESAQLQLAVAPVLTNTNLKTNTPVAAQPTRSEPTGVRQVASAQTGSVLLPTIVSLLILLGAMMVSYSSFAMVGSPITHLIGLP